MAHSLILGQTESGKTTLAKRLSHYLKQERQEVIVLDPLNDPEWAADFRCADPKQFLDVFWSSRQCHVFIDEAGDMVGRFDETMQQTATSGRHWGHSCYYISQRGAMVSPTVRAQCRHVFLFASSFKDCKVLSEEYNCPELLQAVDFPAGRYLHKERFKPVEIGELWAQVQKNPNSRAQKQKGNPNGECSTEDI